MVNSLFLFQFLGFNALFMGIFDEIEIAMVAICLMKRRS